MTPAEIARAMATFIREHGFSPEYCEIGSGCGCFMRAAYEVAGPGTMLLVWPTLNNVVGAQGFFEHQLLQAGWDAGCTADAAAACDIAADLLTP